MFRPGSHVFQCAPGKAQGAKIANQKIHQLWDYFPLLKEEILGEGNFGADYVRLTFRNGSLMDIMSPINSTRGNRATAGILDEYRRKLTSRILKKLNFLLEKLTFIQKDKRRNSNDRIYLQYH